MKKFLLLVALLCVTVVSCKADIASVVPASALSQSDKAAHHIHFNMLLGGDSCSAVAVGSHTLLTAAHCVLGTSKLDIDGSDAKITGIYYDEQDHALIVEDGVTFSDYRDIDQREPVAGEHVRLWGWPGDRDTVVLREGTFDKIAKSDLSSTVLYVYTVPIYPGDSGAGVISDDGKVITVVSLGDKQADMACFKLAFTPQQLAQIK